MNTDLTLLWQVVLPLAVAALGALGAALIARANATLKLQAGSAAADDLDQALQHGIALALDALKSIAAHNPTLTLPAGVLGQAAALVVKLAPAAISVLGITTAEIEDLISAHVGVHPANPVNTAPVVLAAPTAAPAAA